MLGPKKCGEMMAYWITCLELLTDPGAFPSPSYLRFSSVVISLSLPTCCDLSVLFSPRKLETQPSHVVRSFSTALFWALEMIVFSCECHSFSNLVAELQTKEPGLTLILLYTLAGFHV